MVAGSSPAGRAIIGFKMFKHYSEILPYEKTILEKEAIWEHLRSCGFSRVITTTDLIFLGRDVDRIAEDFGYEFGVFTILWVGYPHTEERWLFFERQDDAVLARMLFD